MKKKVWQKDSSTDLFWIYGIHAVRAALENSHRLCHKLIYLIPESFEALGKAWQRPSLICSKTDKNEFHTRFGMEAVHQGIGLQISPLLPLSLEELMSSPAEQMVIATLDQITDPHNQGAIVRSAAAFGVQAILMPDRHSPLETSAILYKAASGALEHVPLIRVTNLARTLELLSKAGFWNLGLDEQGQETFSKSNLKGRVNLVLGREGEGLRRLTRERCDVLIHLPTAPSFTTLNVSNAAAIAFYEAFRQQKDLFL